MLSHKFSCGSGNFLKETYISLCRLENGIPRDFMGTRGKWEKCTILLMFLLISFMELKSLILLFHYQKLFPVRDCCQDFLRKEKVSS